MRFQPADSSSKSCVEERQRLAMTSSSMKATGARRRPDGERSRSASRSPVPAGTVIPADAGGTADPPAATRRAVGVPVLIWPPAQCYSWAGPGPALPPSRWRPVRPVVVGWGDEPPGRIFGRSFTASGSSVGCPAGGRRPWAVEPVHQASRQAVPICRGGADHRADDAGDQQLQGQIIRHDHPPASSINRIGRRSVCQRTFR